MPRRLIGVTILILILVATSAIIWINSVKGKADLTLAIKPTEINISTDDEAIRETISRASELVIEAEYTFDTSQFDKVYINDSRGGEITDEALALIREIRSDPTIQKDQVGILDYKRARIETQRRLYGIFMAELRVKEAAGTLTEEERLILQVDTFGWPTSQPIDENLIAQVTQACEQFLVEVAAWKPTQKPTAAYPEPETVTPEPDAYPAYPMPERKTTPELVCPTLTPSPTLVFDALSVPHRSRPPEMYPQSYSAVYFYSIEIDGDLAKAIVHERHARYEYVLVKMDGQWYIAGVKFLKVEL